MRLRFILILALAAMAGLSLTPNTQSVMPAEKPILYYVFDPLCGWCYGFSPTIQAIAARYKDKLTVEVISGGMVTGKRVGPIGQVAGFISSAYKDVERTTGTKFGEGFLKGTMAKGTAIFSSSEPSQALAVVRSHHPEKALAFAHALQHAIYYDGVAPTDFEGLAPYAAQFGVDKATFMIEVKSPAIQQQVLKEFRTSDSLKVQGFPTLFIQKNNQLHRIAAGYTSEKELASRIDQVLAVPAKP